jgi:predicted AAA+ superfamily ATPase
MRPYTVEERQMSDKYFRISELLSMKNGDEISGETALTIDDYLEEIFRSGFPEIRKKSERIRRTQLKSYIQNIIDHEFSENGFSVKKPKSLYAWMQAYAGAIATQTKFQTIIDAAMANNSEAPSRPTANEYREALSILYIIDEVPPFIGVGKLFPTLSKAPKHFMLDPAIALTLLGVTREQLTQYQVPSHVRKFEQDLIGQLMESLVYQSLVVYAEANEAELYHFRENKTKREIDFIVKKGNHLILFEVKADNAAKDKYFEHMNWFEKNVGENYRITKVLLNTGSFAFTRKQDGSHVIPIGMLGV